MLPIHPSRTKKGIQWISLRTEHGIVLYNNSLTATVCSESLSEAKKTNKALAERLQTLQTQLSDSELKRTQLETEARQTHNVCRLRYKLQTWLYLSD